MMRSVRRDTRIAVAAEVSDEFMSVMSATSIATSVPEPIAMPRPFALACARAAASFTPSPTIATVRPSACRLATVLRLPSGRTPAMTRSMPT